MSHSEPRCAMCAIRASKEPLSLLDGEWYCAQHFFGCDHDMAAQILEEARLSDPSYDPDLEERDHVL